GQEDQRNAAEGDRGSKPDERTGAFARDPSEPEHKERKRSEQYRRHARPDVGFGRIREHVVDPEHKDREHADQMPGQRRKRRALPKRGSERGQKEAGKNEPDADTRDG